MVIDAILNFILLLIQGFLFILPDGGVFPTEFTSSITNIVTEVMKWSKVFPVESGMVVIGILLSFEAGIIAFKTIQWLLRVIRG